MNRYQDIKQLRNENEFVGTIGDKYYSYDVSWFANNYEDYDIINLKDEMYNDIVNIALAVATVTVVVAITKIVMYYV